jgi:hypothetical protein
MIRWYARSCAEETLPIILASGHSLNPEDCRLGPLVKAIIKPVDPADLDKLIEGLCG